MEVVLLIAIAMWISFGFLGGWISGEKGRASGEGFLLGFLFGPLGVLIAALLPQDPEGLADRQEQARETAEAITKQNAELRAQHAAYRKYAEEHAEQARIQREIAAARFREWFGQEVIRFGWYRRLPDLAQAIVLGLSFALPAVVVLAFLFRQV